MSVINQLLLDLEKRRVSGAERSVLPNHARALPNEERSVRWGWIAGGGGVAVAALGAAWVLLSGMVSTGAAPLAPARGADVAIEKVVAASAGVVMEARHGDTG